MENTESFYLIKQLMLLTGFTDRTIRNYISAGILEGEKVNGMWHFSPEQVERFICHPAVRPSILAKQNALVYDFLSEDHKASCEACMILDVPGANKKEFAEFFCCRISHGDYENIHFAFDGVPKVPRVILKGNAGEVLRLVNEYNQEKPFSR